MSFFMENRRRKDVRSTFLFHTEWRDICMKKKQTFIIEVSDTQSQSWQGSIEWIQGQKKQGFRSVLELLKLMDSVVCEEEQ